MRRGVGYLVFGVAVGLLAAGAVVQAAKKRRAGKPKSIRAKIENQLDLLERQLSRA